MTYTYSTYEAKSRFSELLQRVRAGHRVLISYHGRVVAEVRPTELAQDSAEIMKELEAAGILAAGAISPTRLAPVRRRRGALARFLASRE